MVKIIKAENIFEESLLPCPFCGTTSEEFTSEGKRKTQFVALRKYLEEPDSYGIPEPQRTRFVVKCTNCGSSGGSAITGYFPLINTTVTEEEAKQTAINKWNRRIK